MIAAARMVLPTLVCSLPSSCSVSTVMLTEVAVKMVPIKMFCSNRLPSVAKSPRLKINASSVPITIGASTPINATIKPDLPERPKSRKLVPIPAENIITITPSSASWVNISVGFKIPNTAGPSSSPASSAPTTCGIWNRRVIIPRIFVLIKISAMCQR